MPSVVGRPRTGKLSEERTRRHCSAVRTDIGTDTPVPVLSPQDTRTGSGTPGWCVSNILVSLVEERECLRVEGRGRSSRAKREPEGAPTAGEGAPKGGREKGKIQLSERAKPR